MIKKFSLILILLSLSSLAYAQVDYQNLNPNGLINSLISNFIEEIKLVSKPIKQASKNLFWILVPISIFLNGFKCIFAEGNIQTFFYALVKIILVIGEFFVTLAKNMRYGTESTSTSISSPTSAPNSAPNSGCYR